MADYATATQAAIRAALVADAGVAALVGDRVVDEPAEGIAFPFIRFGTITPRPDDTDATLGAQVAVGIEAHSRPEAGRIEATRILEAVAAALHRRPEILDLGALHAFEIEVQTWTVTRDGDGQSYTGTLALDLTICA
ncbi:MAG: DUF3168 domain-containing protein [Limimaricola soesokkakensis]|uniref:DUF3168 domain-containing protein n=1 Tax=Limimaricola soesokkakensis TaxID=1343159 RepID=UPI00405837A7